jgi:hypothetical protein
LPKNTSGIFIKIIFSLRVQQGLDSVKNLSHICFGDLKSGLSFS